MNDVVVAAATPWGHGALAMVRLSGDDVLGVLDRVLEGAPKLPPTRWRRCRFRDDQVFDDGMAVYAAGPNTYTGEDTAELTCHGNPAIVERLLAACQAAGARLARPGEFTRRALVNGKLDLLRAEAVLQVSQARTQRGVAVGRSALDGELGRYVGERREILLDVAAELEARLDYPNDELAVHSDGDLVARLQSVADDSARLAGSYRAGKILVNGARVALVGAVNAGKSSLFNALVGTTRALVHETPGTTRDVLEVATTLGGVAVTLLDTAGERVTTDPIEAAGLALARELVQDADLLLVVLRARAGGPSEVERALLERTEDRERVVVYNGVDAPDAAPAPERAVSTIAVRGEGVEALVERMVETLSGEAPGHSRLVIASARQRDLLQAVHERCSAAIQALPVAGVAVAADAVTEALEELDALTGADTREDVLGALFARFCIGK